MATTHNGSSQPKQRKATTAKTSYRRSPYRENTRVIRVPESLLPRVHRLLAECKQDVADSICLD